MDVLVLGGTSFVGRTIVADLLARGHTPTLFSRGRTNPDVFPGVARRVGDRDTGDYASLAGGRWDAVVDVSAYVPRHVDQAMTAAGEDVARYLLISTVSVYDGAQAPETGLDEEAPRSPEVRDTEDRDRFYGELKVACENDVVARLGPRATIVRPGIVAGPWDTTDRFTYWARRAAAGGTVAVPGRLDQPAQVIDARDLGRLCSLLLEDDRTGVFNAVGPADPVTVRGLLEACAAAAGTNVEPVEVPPARVHPDKPFPLLLDDPADDRLFRASGAAARRAGMPATPLERTAADVLAWDRGRGTPPIDRGFSPEQEAEALARIPGA